MQVLCKGPVPRSWGQKSATLDVGSRARPDFIQLGLCDPAAPGTQQVSLWALGALGSSRAGPFCVGH